MIIENMTNEQLLEYKISLTKDISRFHNLQIAKKVQL